MSYFVAALYGSIFSNETEAAFSNYRLWESMGFVIAFAYSSVLCTSVKLYILSSMLVLGVTGFYIVKFLKWKKKPIKPTESTERECMI